MTWCKALPLVKVPQGDTPKPVTLVLPYYENARFFEFQVEGWAEYPEHLKPYVSAVVVDDGSPTSAAENVLIGGHPFPMRLFRIELDIRWNWLAARNIGMHHASTDWCLLTDMDHVVPAETLRSIVYGQHDPRVIYAFSRREHTGEAIAPHSASFLMTKALFWTVGGYDEALSGFYGSDGDWRRRCAKVAPIEVLTDALVRYEYVDDSSTTRYQRKQPEDAAVHRIVAARGTGWAPKTLSFPYHEVAV